MNCSPASRAGAGRGKTGKLEAFLDSPGVSIHPIDETTADFYAEIVQTLRAQGTPIPVNDIWIAATAAHEDMLRLDRTADMIRATRRFLVSQTNRPTGDQRRVSCNLRTFLDHLSK